MPLTAEDLAYMRMVQADHRPTPADLRHRTSVNDGLGGRTDTFGPVQPVQVRLDGTPDEVPASIADRAEGGTLVHVVMDLVQVYRGDTLTVSATEAYEVVSEGDPDRWNTAQEVWARRTVFPAR